LDFLGLGILFVSIKIQSSSFLEFHFFKEIFFLSKIKSHLFSLFFRIHLTIFFTFFISFICLLKIIFFLSWAAQLLLYGSCTRLASCVRLTVRL